MILLAWVQAVNWTGSKFVGGLSSIDVALEEAEVLKKLEPEAPLGEDEGMTRDCNQVCSPALIQPLVLMFRVAATSSLNCSELHI